MTTVAIYARYSSDRQNERSISDQLAVLNRHAEAKGWSVTRVFSDAAISGSAMANRPGLLDALAAAERGEFDILLAEDEDRLARNLEHQAHVLNRLKALGISIATLKTDRMTVTDAALRGLMAELFLENLSQKTKRGMHSNAEKGLATGARLYGYRTAPGGLIEIVPDQAEVIRRVAERYVAGDTPRQIATALNADHLPGPSGGAWSASTINGSRQRANGILNTELYAGVKVWNRMDVRKDPRTGKRKPTMRPEAEWKRTPVPHLQIIPDDLWRAVRERKAIEGANAPHTLVRHPRIFSGLLRCGFCGSSYTTYTTGKIVCTGYRQKGTCENRRTPRLEEIEQRALEGLRDKLLAPEAVARAVRTYHQAAQAHADAAAAGRAPLERRLGEVKRGIERVIDAIVDGTANAGMKARMMEMDAERIELEARLAQDEAPRPVALHPRAAQQYAKMAEALQPTLALAAGGETAAQRELVAAVRDLIDHIEITPRTQERGGPIDMVLHGRLALMLEEPHENARLGAVVAGASYTRRQPSVPVSARLAG